MVNVYISLLTFNDNTATLECLESLETLKKENYNLSVVVTDNASIDKFIEVKKYKNFKLEILRNEQNLGFSGGHNVGINYSIKHGADYVVILNNDTISSPDLVFNLLKAFKNDVGITVPKIYFAKGYEFHKDKYKENELGKVFWYAGGEIDWNNIFGKHIGVDEVDHGQYDKEKQTEVATGCCMMVKSAVFGKVGLLDDTFFLYYEDADFSIKTNRKNFKIVYVPSAVIWHKNAAATGGSGSALQDYYITRNRMIFGFRYASLRAKQALFRESIRILLKGREMQKKGIKDFYLRKYGKGTYFKNE